MCVCVSVCVQYVYVCTYTACVCVCLCLCIRYVCVFVHVCICVCLGKESLISLKWGNCDRICVRQECNNCQLINKFTCLILCMSGILYNFYRYVENAQNSNLLCWIEDLLRKPQIPEWLFVIAEIQQ